MKQGGPPCKVDAGANTAMIPSLIDIHVVKVDLLLHLTNFCIGLNLFVQAMQR